MAAPIRAGIVGTGFMGTVHTRSVLRADGIVTRIVGSTPATSRAAAARLGLSVTEDLDALLAADDVDVVHVCTPNATHASIARAAIAAGKHVICEKPLATTADEALDLAEAAAAARVVATVPFVYRFYPTVREARARVADGRTGAVRLMHGSYLQDWLSDENDDDWRVRAEAGGRSRTFADIGVHWCDLAEFVTGHRIAALCARTVVAVPERGGRPVETEDAAVLMFTTDRGATGSLTVSQVSPGRKNRLLLEVDGAAESLVFDQEKPESLWIGGREVNRILLRGTESAGAARYSTLPAGHPQGYADSFAAFVADTYAAVGGTVPDGLPTFTDGLRSARLTRAVLDSSAKNSWVEVPS